jgi:SAM-dependent methyltransferase
MIVAQERLTTNEQPGSGSLRFPDHWWYRARSRLLRRALEPFVPDGMVVDVGSADGPSVSWLTAIPVDRDPRGLRDGVCADAANLPFPDRSIDAVSAFDVVEHVSDDSALLAEFHRVLKPAGRLLVSVPAYQWAWSEFDERAGHHRRYTRRQLVETVQDAGFTVERATYAFASTLPLFALARLIGSGGLGPVPRWQDRVLTTLSRIDERCLTLFDLPFGSSVFLAARVSLHSRAASRG